MKTKDVMASTNILTKYPNVLKEGVYNLQTKMTPEGFAIMKDHMLGHEVLVVPMLYKELKNAAEEIDCTRFKQLISDFETASTSSIDVSTVLKQLSEVKEQYEQMDEAAGAMNNDLETVEESINELQSVIRDKMQKMDHVLEESKKMYAEKLKAFKKQVETINDAVNNAVKSQQFAEVRQQVEKTLLFVKRVKEDNEKRVQWEHKVKEAKVQKLLESDPTGEKLIAFLCPMAEFGDGWSQGRLGQFYFERKEYDKAHMHYVNAAKAGYIAFATAYMRNLLDDMSVPTNIDKVLEILEGLSVYELGWPEKMYKELKSSNDGSNYHVIVETVIDMLPK